MRILPREKWSPGSRRRWTGLCTGLFLWLGVAGFLVTGAAAATLPNAVTEVMTKLGANLQARGEIVARLDNGEVAIEYQDEQVPAYGAELLVFATSGSSDAAAGAVAEGLIFHGSVSVRESAGHLNLAIVDQGASLVAVGDRVFLPPPLQLYFVPVRNLTPYFYLTSQATAAFARLLRFYPDWRIFTLPGSNRTTVTALQRQCRVRGRYGLVVQPLILFVNGRFKLQLRLTSLFSGVALAPLEAAFHPFAGSTSAPRIPTAVQRPLTSISYPGAVPMSPSGLSRR